MTFLKPLSVKPYLLVLSCALTNLTLHIPVHFSLKWMFDP